MVKLLMLVGLLAGFASATPVNAADQIGIVAAENFYGDIAQQIGGAQVKVVSILTNPDQDPHLFEASASVAREISAAKIVIYNGIAYDSWMEKLLASARNSDRHTIVVADLAGYKPGENPHIWYDPTTMRALATELTVQLAALDPAHAQDFQRRFQIFSKSLQPVDDKISSLDDRLAGRPVTATEPVFGYMFKALDLVSRNQSFQLSVMNNTEPSAGDIAAFENDLKTHQVQLLIYNSQASDPIAARMEKLAKASHVPVVGAAETEPKGETYQAWMLDSLAAIDTAMPSAALPQ